MLWIRNGAVDVATRDDEIGILMDIGALDVKERIQNPNTKVIVLTEDEITTPLSAVLQSSGFDLAKTSILPSFGLSAMKQLRPLVNMIQKTNPKAKIVVHRDRDFLFDDEVEEWKVAVRKLGVEPYVTSGRDIESTFLNAAQLSQLNPELKPERFEKLISKVGGDLHLATQVDYVNGRIDYLRKKGEQVNAGAISAEATKSIADNGRKFYGKTVLRAVRGQFQKDHGKNLIVYSASAALKDDSLGVVAQKAF